MVRRGGSAGPIIMGCGFSGFADEGVDGLGGCDCVGDEVRLWAAILAVISLGDEAMMRRVLTISGIRQWARREKYWELYLLRKTKGRALPVVVGVLERV